MYTKAELMGTTCALPFDHVSRRSPRGPASSGWHASGPATKPSASVSRSCMADTPSVDHCVAHVICGAGLHGGRWGPLGPQGWACAQLIGHGYHPGRSLRDGIFFFLLRTANHQPPPTTNRRQPPAATNRQLPTTANRQQPPTTNHHQPPTAANHHQLPPTTSCQPPATNHQPPTATNHG